MKTKLIEHDGMTFEVIGDGKRKTILEYGDGSNLRADWVQTRIDPSLKIGESVL